MTVGEAWRQLKLQPTSSKAEKSVEFQFSMFFFRGFFDLIKTKWSHGFHGFHGFQHETLEDLEIVILVKRAVSR